MTGVIPMTYVSVQSQPEINQGRRQMLTEIALGAGSSYFFVVFQVFQISFFGQILVTEKQSVTLLIE